MRTSCEKSSDPGVNRFSPWPMSSPTSTPSLLRAAATPNAESEVRFREDLLRSVLFALLAGVVVSAAGILRIRWLERRAHQQHQQAEQTE